MASLDFPSNPTNNQTYALNGVTYYYNAAIGAWLTQLSTMNLSTSSNTQVLFNDAGLANGSSGFVFDKGSGNLGIGTTNPVTTLHISDGNTSISSVLYTSDFQTISAQGTAPGFNIIAAANTAAGRGVFKATRARGTLSSPLVPILNDNTFSLLGTIYDGTTGRATAGINMDVDGTVSDNVAPQRISFWTGLTNTRTEKMRIGSDGNVGIGTTSPEAKLHVSGGNILLNNNQNIAFKNSSGTPYGVLQVDGSNNLLFGSTNFTGAHIFALNGSERARIDASGNLLTGGKTSATSNSGDIQVSRGIGFPATQVACSDANTLDDYEEGTWTPTLVPSTGTITSQITEGSYIKVGRLVTLTFSARITGGTVTVISQISGLPFVINTNTPVGASREWYVTGTMWETIGNNGQSTFGLIRYDNSSTCTNAYAWNGTFSYITNN
jgi:hypothetical protein